MPTVHLTESVGTAVIISHPNGVFYSNQAGGTSCLHPSLEGILVPFSNDVDLERDGGGLLSPDFDLHAYFTGPKHRGTGATSDLDPEDADAIDAILVKSRAGSWLRVDRTRLQESCEAWVHVIISQEHADDLWALFSGFEPYPRNDVLVWTNSD